jgi:molybdopterin biosynthesis enzyme
MKPGGSMMAAEKNGKLYLAFGKPGGRPAGPVHGRSALFQEAVRPCLRAAEPIRVYLKKPLSRKAPSSACSEAGCSSRTGGPCFEEDESRGNGALSSFLESDMLAEVPAGSPKLPAGTLLKGYRI